jgi:hypothetical protein
MAEHPKCGWLITGPPDSPENAFRTPAGGYCNEFMGPTCNLVLAYARFSVCLEAQALLLIDSSFSSKLKLARQNLPPLPFHQQTGTSNRKKTDRIRQRTLIKQDDNTRNKWMELDNECLE